MTGIRHERAPAARQRDEGTVETHMAARLGIEPTDLTDLLRNRPAPAPPAAVRAAWIERKQAMVRAIEDAAR
ncbi:hypothetical protein [Segeticoccus rhizosphaerae]|uniref:hypothetical protein n=1 Tax=Segeticoccus rhizosphaerae TaxID=1104777 RepID=UPI0010C052AD|nr:hypothetical protein [Ornithinicoccus soli]